MGNSKDKERQQYIELNHLQDSYIDKKILYQYKNVLPERRFLGKTKDEKYKIFYEETRGSLVKRNYGKSQNVTSWNLLFSDGEKSEKITKEFLQNNELTLFDCSKDDLMNFIENNSKRVNPLDTSMKKDRRRRSIWANDEEFEIIQEFIRKLRARG